MEMMLIGLLGTLWLITAIGWLRCYRQKLSIAQENGALLREIEEIKTEDIVSGCWNIRFFAKMANVQIKLAHRHRWPMTLIAIDIERLERINMRHGFKTGDALLRHLCETLKTTCRSSDIVGRYLGSTFFVLLQECNEQNVWVFYARIKQKLDAPLMMQDKSIDFTYRSGAMTLYGKHCYLKVLQKGALAALQEAKQNQKNFVVKTELQEHV